MGVKHDITAFARQLGIDMIGYARAVKFESAEKEIIKREEMGIRYPFVNTPPGARCDPEKSLPGAKTIISAALAYTVSDRHLPQKPDAMFKGYISRYAVGPDYHRVLGGKLSQLAGYISSILAGVNCRVFIDSGEMLDRACAQRAGIGWFSPNTCITTRKYGSWVFLGEIITDAEIEPDKPAFSVCLNCNRCVNACPTGALVEPYIMNPDRCLSYITQMGGYIPFEFRELMGHRIYGCDTCQLACPINHDAAPADNPELLPVINPEQDIIKLLKIDNRTFKSTFGLTAAGWRGKNIILRNAVIALGNYRDAKALPVLTEVLRHSPSPVVRGHAAWALAVAGGRRAEDELAKALKDEPDDITRCQIEYVISEVIG